MPRLVQRTEFGLRLRDADGAWMVVPLEPVEIEYLRVGTDAPGAESRAFVTSGWVYCEADIGALKYEAQGPSGWCRCSGSTARPRRAASAGCA